MNRATVIILRLSDSKPSGVVRFVNNLSLCIKNDPNFEIILVTFDIFGTFTDYRYTNSILEIRLPYLGGNILLTLDEREKYIHFNYIFSIISPYIEGSRSLILHVQEMCLMEFASFIKTRIYCKIVFHQHVLPWKFSFEKNEDKFKEIYGQVLSGDYSFSHNNILELNSYLKADYIITVTKMMKDYICAAFEEVSDKVTHINNGLEFVSNSKVSELDVDIIFVGRLSKEKGFYEFIEALNILKERGVHLKACAIGEYTSELIKFVNTKYKNLNLSLLGILSYEELIPIYNRKPIGVIPSFHEQCSYTAIEMCMFGLPIVYSKVDGLAEMFTDGKDGLGTPLSYDMHLGISLDTIELANNIEKLTKNESLRQALSHEANRTYIRKFTLESMYNSIKKIYVL